MRPHCICPVQLQLPPSAAAGSNRFRQLTVWSLFTTVINSCFPGWGYVFAFSEVLTSPSQ